MRITPEGSKGSNFAFDVTPSKLVAGLITENGICLPNENDIKKLMRNLYSDKELKKFKKIGLTRGYQTI